MTYTAKRLGWDDPPDPARELDVEPLAEKGYASDDLAGELLDYTTPAGVRVVLVGGQEADPKTVRPAGHPEG